MLRVQQRAPASESARFHAFARRRTTDCAGVAEFAHSTHLDIRFRWHKRCIEEVSPHSHSK
jgi:hypothetical protein